MSLLTKAHRADLKKSGLTDETIEACRFYSATASEVKDILGRDLGPGMACPYLGSGGTAGFDLVRIKLDTPLEKMKYASPSKKVYVDGNRLYICPLLNPDALEDPEIELIFTEGEKKAAAGCQAGIPTIGLIGVWGFRGRDSKDRRVVIDDLNLINFVGRSVLIVFDSDAVDNPSIRDAEIALSRELRSRGAIVSIVRLPSPSRKEVAEWGTKFGMDDFIEARGIDELNHLIDWARNPLPLGCRPVTILENLPERDRPWLVQDIWKVGDCGFLAGPPKTMKSLLSLDLAICVATGERFLGLPVTKGTVIVVDEETNRMEFRNRIRSLAEGRGFAWSDLKDIHFVEKGSLRLDDAETIEELRELCRQMEPRLIILDPFVRMHRRDENSSQEMSPMLEALRRVSDEFDVSIMIVHHFNKSTTGTPSGRMRGSSDLHGWYDGAIFTDTSGKCIKLSFAYRYGSPIDPMSVSLENDGDRGIYWEVVGGKSEAERISIDDRVVELLREKPIKASDLSKSLSRSGGDINAALSRLVTAKLVVCYEGTGGFGRPPKMVRLRSKDEDLLSDDFNSPKKKTEVRKSVGPDEVAGPDTSGDTSTSNGVSDSASALTGSSYVRNTPSAWPNLAETNGLAGRRKPTEEDAESNDEGDLHQRRD